LLCQSYFMPNYRNFVAKIANFVPKTALFWLNWHFWGQFIESQNTNFAYFYKILQRHKTKKFSNILQFLAAKAPYIWPFSSIVAQNKHFKRKWTLIF
jgi:hypothetical protein